jgi:uncharacterized damage-inducible protein DinB
MFDAMAALPPGETTKERQSLFKTMVLTMNHLYVADLIWQAHVEGREHGFPALNHVIHSELAPLREAQEKLDDWYIDWAESLSQDQLNKEVDFTLIGGNQGRMSNGQILMHVVNHTSYHRGFVGDMFYQVPLRAPTTDLPVYLRTLAATAAK